MTVKRFEKWAALCSCFLLFIPSGENAGWQERACPIEQAQEGLNKFLGYLLISIGFLFSFKEMFVGPVNRN
tara:strand:+ start:105 stop:317 length:213 start_codon:yes stop_codon:yes gene_type:complete